MDRGPGIPLVLAVAVALATSVLAATSADEVVLSTATCSSLRGDCGADGTVSIGELQRAVNMSVGTASPACGVDSNGDNVVSGAELQAVVDSYLGLRMALQVSMKPTSATLGPGGTLPLVAAVLGCPEEQGVTWSVQEGTAGGSVTADGVYTAATLAGTFHVVAASSADPSRTAVATVAVLPRTTLAERTFPPSPNDQTLSVPGKLEVTIPGGALEKSATVTVLQVSGVPSPPAEYTSPTGWYQVLADGGAPSFAMTVTFPGATGAPPAPLGVLPAATVSRPVVLTYKPPAFFEVPSTADLVMAGSTHAAGSGVTLDNRGTVIGPAFAHNKPDQPYTTLEFKILYSSSGIGAPPDDSEYTGVSDNIPGIPNYVEDSGLFLESGLSYLTRDLAMQAPVYSDEQAKKYFAFIGNYDTSQWGPLTGYIYIANKFSNPGINWKGQKSTLLQSELTHELTHAVENRYRTFAGMRLVKWLTESICDFTAYRQTDPARELMEVKLVNFGDWFRYQYWSGQEEMFYLGAAWLDRAADEGALDLDGSFMENQYKQGYSQSGAASSLMSTYTGMSAIYAELVQFYLFDSSSPLANIYYPLIKAVPRNLLFRGEQATKANRLAYDEETITEKTFTLGEVGGLLQVTADLVSVMPSSKTVTPKDDTVHPFSVELKTDLASREEAWFYQGKGGRPVGDPEMMPPKGQSRFVKLGKKETADCFWVLVINPNSPDTTPTVHQVVVRTLHISALEPTSGIVGSIVTIRGGGFGSSRYGNTVTFSDANAEVVSWADNEIKVKVPDDAPGSSKVKVTVKGLDSNEVQFIVTLQVTVTATSEPVVDCSVSPPQQQTTTWAAAVTSPYKPTLSYAWRLNETTVGGNGSTYTRDTTDCPVKTTGPCPGCSFSGLYIYALVTDGLGRTGTGVYVWDPGAY